MFKKKKAQNEINMTYFFGGTAVGMAAGLLFRKLLSNTSNEKTDNCEPKVLISKNGNKYSQDDNFHKLYDESDGYNNHTSSKSASQHEEKKCPEQEIPLNKFDKDFEYNMNNLDINHTHDNNIQKKYCDHKNHTLYNISIENNAKYNLHMKTLSENFKEEKKYNNYQLLKPENMEIEPDDNESTKNDNVITDINMNSIDSNNETNTQKQIKTVDNIESIDAINPLSIGFCGNVTSYKNLQNINSSMSKPDILPDYVDNLSNMVTSTNSICFNNDKDIEQFNFPFTEELCETVSISSTKQDNLEEI